MRRRNMKGLRPWRRGISGNPRGRPPGIGKLIGLVPGEAFAELVLILFRGTITDIQKIARSRTRPALQVLIARALIGDLKRMEIKNLCRLLNRIIGKPPRVVEYWLTCKRCGVSEPVGGPLKAR